MNAPHISSTRIAGVDVLEAANSVLQVVAGFYDFEDPKYIYVRDGLGPTLEAEVKAHETYHRTLTSSTLYGGIFQSLDYLTRKHKEGLREDLRAGFQALRNDLIKRMYLVQEGGAVTRAWAFQGLIHQPNSDDEHDRLTLRYFERLTPWYRELGFLYASVLFRLLDNARAPVSTIVLSYANDALGMFLMNASALMHDQMVSFAVDDTVFLQPGVAPDQRFFTLLDCLQDARVLERFRAEALRSLKRAFDCEDFGAQANSRLIEAARDDPEHFEHRVISGLHKGLELAIPGFAITLDGHMALAAAIRWRVQLNEFFSTIVPDYVPYKTGVAMDEQSKKEVNSYIKHFL